MERVTIAEAGSQRSSRHCRAVHGAGEWMKARTQIDPERRRIFILSSGRSGSTLLAAILADAGAEFGMPTPQHWNPGTGDLEHPELHRMAAWMGYAYDLSVDRPSIGPSRYLWDFYRSMGKSHLRRLLHAARYIKGEGADFAVQPAFKMGYFPTVIVSYRRFEAFATSSGLMRGHSNFETLVKYYNRVNRNGLLLLQMFGGSVVGYEHLSDAHDTSWAAPLATATGLPVDLLLAARNRRLRTSHTPEVARSWDTSTTETYVSINALHGLALPPSPQALRSWAQKRERTGKLEPNSISERPMDAPVKPGLRRVERLN